MRFEIYNEEEAKSLVGSRKHVNRNIFLTALERINVGESLILLKKDKWFYSQVHCYFHNMYRGGKMKFKCKLLKDGTGWLVRRIE